MGGGGGRVVRKQTDMLRTDISYDLLLTAAGADMRSYTGAPDIRSYTGAAPICKKMPISYE